MPEELKERIFEKLFGVADIAKFSPQEVQAYEDSLKSYRDLKNWLDTAREEGLKEGIEKGFERVALNGLRQRKSDEIIIELTGLSQEQMNYVKEKIKRER